MASSPAKIGFTAFEAAIWTLLGLAVVLAAIRTHIRIYKFHRLFVDDGFLFLATTALIGGTVLIHLDAPYLYLQVNVESGAEAAPPNFIQQLLSDQKLQDSATVLLAVTIFSVKYSFLFFFHSLVRRVRTLTIWWWCVFAIVIPSTIVCICSSFIACPYFGEEVLVSCVTPQALARENATLIATTVVDIISDVLLISIPVALLWRVRISLRRKLTLGAILCLSVFMIITCIIKVSAGNTINGQVDTTWVVFWYVAEAAIAVIMVSVTAFRSLFVTDIPKYAGSPTAVHDSHTRLWSRKKANTPDEMASMSGVSGLGVRTSIGQNHSYENDSVKSGSPTLPRHGIRVTHNISTTQRDQLSEQIRPSYESWV
ncbi:hypothetical protein MMC30_004056 [Trapelia coarctata]|nr:hypothetical protein [Trapelia coarctata]